jgi:hypothetical protein
MSAQPNAASLIMKLTVYVGSVGLQSDRGGSDDDADYYTPSSEGSGEI